ncbi:hypothetical protein [Chryseobacterium sp. JUb7]|uniref:hypothetical protein n=1 Tax=Chryseobacterium sp. JUb7 TaxID=2940599 RepID=UPI002169C989|nr:hypothetical protein [Chryseobacterium sp. JUb7]MCS3528776.1 hypothetical protein [Chryseobacterium sp. JUb7]
MKNKNYILPLLCFSTFYFCQDKISKKNGHQLDAKIIEIGPSNIIYKELDNLDGPTRSLDRSEIFQITYNNGKTEVFGKYSNTNDVKDFIVNKINEFGIDRDDDHQKLQAKFEGDQIEINSINKKGKVLNEDVFWDLSKVIKFHNISARKNNVYYLNIVTYKTEKSKVEIDKLVIKMTDYEAAVNVLEAMKDLQIMLKKD